MSLALVPYRALWRAWAEAMTGAPVEDTEGGSGSFTEFTRCGATHHTVWDISHPLCVLLHEVGHTVGGHGAHVACRDHYDPRYAFDFYPYPQDRLDEKAANIFAEEVAHTLGVPFPYSLVEDAYKPWSGTIPVWRWREEDASEQT